MRITSALWHNYFSFAHAITLLVNDVTRNMTTRELTDVAVVRQLLWDDLNLRMGGSSILEKQWVQLSDFLSDMVNRPLPSHDWGGPQIAPGVTQFRRPVIEPISILDDLYLFCFNFVEYDAEDQAMVVVYGQEVLKSLAPTSKMISKFQLSPEALQDYTEKYAKHHLPEVDALDKDASKGGIEADYKKWKPIGLMMVLLHDFASRHSRQQCEELVFELSSVVVGEVTSNIRYFIDTFLYSSCQKLPPSEFNSLRGVLLPSPSIVPSFIGV